MRYINFIVIWICFVLTFTSYGQTHDWAFGIKSSGGNFGISAQAVDDSSNVYIGGNFNGEIYLGKDTFKFASSTQRTIFIAKYDKDGNYLWGKSLPNAFSASLTDILINKKNKIIFFGDYRTSSNGNVTFGNYNLNRSSGVFAAFANPNGTFTSAVDLAYGYFVGGRSFALGTKDEIHAFLYLNGFGSGWNIGTGSGATSGPRNNYSYSIAKFDSSGVNLSWNENYDLNDIRFNGDITVDKDNQVYYTFVANSGRTIHGFTTPSNLTTNYIVWRRPNGNYYKKIITTSTSFRSSQVNRIIAVDSNTHYLAGNAYDDSIRIGNSKVYALSANPTRSFNYIAQLKNFDTLSWHRSTSHQFGSVTGYHKLERNGEFTYFSTLQNSSGFSFGGFSTNKLTPAMVSKLDNRGNVLWYIPLNSTSAPLLSGIGAQDVVYSGAFKDSINLKPFTLRNQQSNPIPFVARTFDYEITRGEVISGPYCAGDTFLVPFTKIGEYDTSNVFIAEISDENGDFFGGQRELGRIKTNKDSVVLGRLPLFQVASSNKYRIRISSTNPVVQSFYKSDTLQLLIYSRDKADPGPDTTICYGDTLMLNTYGGTSWKWSPSYAMNDSNLRTPLVNPLMDTTYQIIISDSSGCGAPDTASIKVSVRSKPTFTSKKQNDTLVCQTAIVKLKNSFNGGLESYYVTWFNSRNIALRKVFTKSKEDSLLVLAQSDTSYYAVLTDSCSLPVDTVFYRIKTYDSMQVNQEFNDTLICLGQEITSKVNTSHNVKDSITYVWRWQNQIDTLSIDSIATWRTYQKDTLILAINNTCENEYREFKYEVNTYSPITNSLNPDKNKTTYCRGEKIGFRAKATGGNPNETKTYNWILENRIYTGDTLTLFTDSIAEQFPNKDSFALISIADDGCTFPSDTVSYSFKLNQPLTLDTLMGFDSVLCLGSKQTLRALSKGGNGSNSYSFLWKYEGNTLSNSDTISLKSNNFRTAAKHKMQLILQDGCSTNDTTDLTFVVPDTISTSLPKLLNPICSSSSIVFRSKTKGGDSSQYSFEWKVNGSPISNLDSLAFTFENNSISIDSTFSVSVEVSDGCNLPVGKDSTKVLVKPNPVVSFYNDSLSNGQSLDTLLCRGQDITWTNKQFYTPVSQLPELLQDGISLGKVANYSFDGSTSNGKDSMVYQLISDPNCASPDTANFILYFRDSLRITPIEDTILCYESDFTLRAKANGGLAAGYSWIWLDKTTNQVLARNDTLAISQEINSREIVVSLNDGCTALEDKDDISINVLKPLKVTINAGILCNDSLALKAMAEGGDTNSYSYSWFKDGNSIGKALDSILLFPKGIEKIQINVSDKCPLMALDSAEVGPALQFEVSNVVDSICEPYTALWNVKSSNSMNYLYTWKEGKEQAENSIQNSRIYQKGNYNFLVYAMNALGCKDSITFPIFVKPLPNTDFTWTPDEPNVDQATVTFSAKETPGLYTWKLMDSIIGNKQTTTYTFTKSNTFPITLYLEKNGCLDSNTQFINILDAYRYFEITAFTPNGDNLNDTYKPYARGVEDMLFDIYNRWGEKIHSGNLNSPAWDGKYNGKTVPIGSYLVRVKLKKKGETWTSMTTVLNVIP